MRFLALLLVMTGCGLQAVEETGQEVAPVPQAVNSLTCTDSRPSRVASLAAPPPVSPTLRGSFALTLSAGGTVNGTFDMH